MKPSRCFSLLLALLILFPTQEVSARGSRSPDDPAFVALIASFIRERHCGKKMPSDAMLELMTDAYPAGSDPLRIGDFAKDMKRRAEAAYKGMPKASRQKGVLCPHLEKVMARWVVDKTTHPDRYR